MAISTLFGPEFFTTGDLSTAGYPGSYFESSAVGGPDAPITGYANLLSAENVHRNEGAGPSGEHVIDAINTGDYTAAGVVFGGFGGLANGQFEVCADGLTVEWKHYFSSSALAEVGSSDLMTLVNGHADGSGGINQAHRFLQVRAIQSSGTSFDWNIDYRSVSGGNFSFPSVVGSADVADDAWHDMKVVVVRSTVTGVYSPPFVGSASVASDGAITLYVDGVAVITATGLQLVINQHATTNPECYYAKGLWHGYPNLGGPATGTWVYCGAADPPPASEPIQAVVIGRGAGADDKAKVTSDLTVLMNLDGAGRTVHRPNTLYIAGDLVVTGDVIYTGATASPTTLYDSLVTTEDGQIVTDSDGNVVFVEGSG